MLVIPFWFLCRLNFLGIGPLLGIPRPAPGHGVWVSTIAPDPQGKGLVAMGVVSSPFRVTARVPGVMKEIGIEHVQHFVDERACPEAFGGKSRRCWGRPKRCAQIHDVRLRSLIGDRHTTRAQGTEIAAKGNAPSSSQFSCDCA